MSNPEAGMKFLTNVEFEKSAIVHDNTNTTFPENPREGTQLTVGGIPYQFTSVGGIVEPTWLPLGAKQNAYVQDVQTPEDVWDVLHKLESEDVQVVTYNLNKEVILGRIQVITPDQVRVTFSSPQSGKVVVLSAQDTFTGIKNSELSESTIGVGTGEPDAGETSTIYVQLDA